jgi:hypothetical protein
MIPSFITLGSFTFSMILGFITLGSFTLRKKKTNASQPFLVWFIDWWIDFDPNEHKTSLP